MFADTAEGQVAAGDGGAGYVSFRHEKYIDKGGPDGGDGGRGGDVIFVADSGRGSLVDFRYKPNLVAKSGGAGGENNKHGRDGSDLLVKVPLGTVVFRVNEDGGREQLADLTTLGEEVIIAHGGIGGFGNSHFKSSVRQTPRIAELGEKGQKFLVQLEIKMLADVGLVGFPNAGKSTFLSVVSNAKPTIASYAFTTLKPQLGVARIDDDEILIADIPGLIEGAATGKGLGDEFLRHIERCEVILHLIDGTSSDVAQDYLKVRSELRQYSPVMLDKPEVVALTKLDLFDDEIAQMQKTELQKVIENSAPIFCISAIAHKNVDTVLRILSNIVQQKRARVAVEAKIENDDVPTISLQPNQLDERFEVKKIGDNEFMVSGSKISRFAERTDFGNPEGVNRLRDIMKKMGIIQKLERLGADGRSIVKINEQTFHMYEWEDEFSAHHASVYRKKIGRTESGLRRGHVRKHRAGEDD